MICIQQSHKFQNSELISFIHISWNELENVRTNNIQMIDKKNGTNNLTFDFSRSIAIIDVKYLVDKLFYVLDLYKRDRFDFRSILSLLIQNFRFNSKDTVIPCKLRYSNPNPIMRKYVDKNPCSISI
jgi:hypothetical protein